MRKILQLKTLQTQKKPQTNKIKSFLLATGLENGFVAIFNISKIYMNMENFNNFEKDPSIFKNDEDYSEVWTERFQLKNENLSAVIDLEWSFDSNFLIVLDHGQEIILWKFNIINEDFTNIATPQKLHRISFGKSIIKSFCADKSMNSFLAISNENIFRINFTSENYTLIHYFDDNIQESQSVIQENENSKQEAQKELEELDGLDSIK